MLGVALGLVARATGATADNPTWLSETLRIIGSSFVTLLRTIVPPLIFLAIVSSIANLRQVTNAARLAWQTLLWFAITALASVLIGIGVGLLIDPARGAGVSAADAAEPSKTGGWLDFLTGIIPANMLGLSASTCLLYTSPSPRD